MESCRRKETTVAEPALDLPDRTLLPAEFQGEYGEILSWLVSRLELRGQQAAVESDLNSQGRRTILSWLDQDLYTFEQKYWTLAAANGKGSEIKEFDVVGDQLLRLRYRCRSIVDEGKDPASANNRFTCPIPHAKDPANLASCKASFRKRLESGETESPGLEVRFRLCGSIMLDVAAWLRSGEFAQAGEHGMSSS